MWTLTHRKQAQQLSQSDFHHVQLRHLLITLLRLEFVVLVLHFSIYFYLCNFNYGFFPWSFLSVRGLWAYLFWFL
jgi:hypothetical protein